MADTLYSKSIYCSFLHLDTASQPERHTAQHIEQHSSPLPLIKITQMSTEGL